MPRCRNAPLSGLRIVEMAGIWPPRGAGTAPREANILDGGAPFYRTSPCADGGFPAVGALEPQFYDVLCKKLGMARIDEKRRRDPAEWPALAAAIGGAILTRRRDAWAAIFAGRDACVAPVLSLD